MGGIKGVNQTFDKGNKKMIHMGGAASGHSTQKSNDNLLL